MHKFILALAILAAPCFADLQNADFEKGLDGWSTANWWYENPKGAGLSEISVADEEGRGGTKALKIVGKDNRGIAMQVFGAYPGRYRISGWVKCENIGDAQATILAEWMDGKNQWMSGSPAGFVTGTTDWQHLEQVVDAPSGARSVHFDLLVNGANKGIAWFDDLEWERIAMGLPAPQPPTIAAETPAGAEGCLQVSWDKSALTEGAVWLLVYCEPEGDEAASEPLPRAVLDTEAGSGMVNSLDVGKTYRVRAVAVNGDMASSQPGAEVKATVSDRQPPRPGVLSARRDGEAVTVSWSPHVLDMDVASLHVCVPGEGDEPRELRAMDVSAERAKPGPLFRTEPLVNLSVNLPADAEKIGVWCGDDAGNRGEVAWVGIKPALTVQSPAPCALWTEPPTAQLPREANMPEGASDTFELQLMRGQAKGFQMMVRPDSDLRDVEVSFTPALHENGEDQIAASWLAYHFVDYVKLEQNSRATPPEELVWPGPADYPDELADDTNRDLPAGQLQPIYIRAMAPRDATPGTYRSTATLQCAEGRRTVEFTIHVSPVEMPQRPRLKFVYWDSWSDPCKQFGVDQRSADGWRVLSRTGELMRVHHQNVVVVPWSLVSTWKKADGSLAHDFAVFDRFIRTFQEQGVDALFCLSHMGGRTTGEWGCPTMGSSQATVRDVTTGEETRVDVLDILSAIEAHIDELGLIDKFSIHVADEPIPVNVDSYRELSAKVHERAPRLRRIDAIHVPDLQGALEIWVPQLNYFEQWLDEFRKAQKAGNEIWFYVAWVPQGKHPNRMIDSAAIKSRILHWMNGMYDTTGYLHWALNRWSIDLMSLVSPGDQYICWPSERFISDSSLRYEAEREGLEDCELMFMLRDALMAGGMTREQSQAHMEQIARRAVRDFQDYTRDWSELEAVRLEMLAELEKAGQ